MTEPMNCTRRFPIAHLAAATGLALLLGLSAGAVNAAPANEWRQDRRKTGSEGQAENRGQARRKIHGNENG